MFLIVSVHRIVANLALVYSTLWELNRTSMPKIIEYYPSLDGRAGGGQDELEMSGRGRRRTSQTHLVSRLSGKFIDFVGIWDSLTALGIERWRRGSRPDVWLSSFKGPCIAVNGNSVSQLRSVTCKKNSRSFTFHPTQVNTLRLNPSHADRYYIYLPRRDGRLSWTSWLDSAPAGSRASDLSITSPTLNQCNHQNLDTVV